MNWQLSLEEKFLLGSWKSNKWCFLTFKNSELWKSRFLPTFSNRLDCIPVFSPCWSKLGQLNLCALQLPEFSLWSGDSQSCVRRNGIFWVIKHAPLNLLKCQLFVGISPMILCFPHHLVGKQLGNLGIVQMCHIEYWISKVWKCLLSNSNRSHGIWFCIQGTDTSLPLDLDWVHRILRYCIIWTRRLLHPPDQVVAPW